jgi:ABC-type transport system involved in multi-copper enzyme maturation permease subunit
MIQQLLTIIRNTFLESIRQPIYVVLLLVSALVTFLLPMLSGYTMEDDNKLLIDMGLSTLLVFGLLLAAFSATGVLSHELENRTVLTVVSKPVPRPLFILGKYLGVCLALCLWYWIGSLDFLLTVRHGVMQTASDIFDVPVLTSGTLAFLIALGVATAGNYLYRWVFSSTLVLSLAATLTVAGLVVLMIGHTGRFQSPGTEFAPAGALAGGQRLIALAMILEAVLLLSAVAVAASTRLGQLMTMVVCAGFFALGEVSEATFGHAMERLSWDHVAGPSTLAAWLLPRLGYWVIPDLQFLWPGQALMLGNSISLLHLATVSAYSLLYVVALLLLAIALFQRREVG